MVKLKADFMLFCKNSIINIVDKFYMKGPLEKRSREGKFKKKQVSLFKNHIQYLSGNKTKIIPLEDIKTIAPSTNDT